jgi:hypothetical protein
VKAKTGRKRSSKIKDEKEVRNKIMSLEKKEKHNEEMNEKKKKKEKGMEAILNFLTEKIKNGKNYIEKK